MKSILLLLLITFAFSLTAQNSYIPSIKAYTTEDGLSSNEVNVIHKDRRGFLWFGTQYGINRFDGQEFQIFTKENTPNLAFNTIHKIAEDGNGYLWLLKTHDKYNHDYTKSDLVLMNIYSGEVVSSEDYFGNKFPFKDENITFFQQLDEQSIFLHSTTDKKAFIYHHKKGFQPFQVPKSLDFIRQVHKQSDGNFLLSGYSNTKAQQRFFCKTTPNGKTLTIGSKGFQVEVSENNQTKTLNVEGFWNLSLRNYLNEKVEQGISDLNLPRNVGQVTFNESEELFWLRMKDHFKVIDRDKNVVFKLPYQLAKQEYKAISFYFDHEKTWIADSENGVKVITLQPNHFSIFMPFQNGQTNSLRGLHEDKTGKFWFSTIHQIGFKDKNGAITVVKNEHHFSRFLEDKAGNIWFGGNQGLNKYDNSTGQLTIFPDSLGSFYWSLFEAENEEIWVDRGSDIMALNQKTQTFRKVIQFENEKGEDFHIYDIQRKDYKSIWVSSSRGLFLIDNQGQLLATFNNKQKGEQYLPAKDFHHLHQDKNGIIWLATGDAGLIELIIKNEGLKIKEYQNFTISSGLSSNALHAVYEDEYGYLWLSSDNGLMQFDKETEQVTKYFKENGVADSEFNRISHTQGTNGKLYFGGLNGWTTFTPKNYASNRDKVQQPILTVNNFLQFSGKKRQFEDLTAQLLANNTIQLRSSDRFFNIKLALLDFYDRKNSIYSYRIKGMYDWQSTKNADINISGLPYGKHTLEIKAQNSNRQQAKNTLSYTIRVLRPFYLQWWFVFLILVALGALAFYYLKWRTQQLLIAQETEQLRNVDKMKSHFFANISHELRTPITLILAPVSHLMKNFRNQSDTEIERQLQSIQNNGKNLLSLVNEVLDLSKLEANKLELHVTPTKIPQFIERLVMTFESAAKVKGVEYQFVSFLQKDIHALLDKGKIEKIINNLLSNALKFTLKGGTIQVILGEINNQLVLKVKDTGRGISEEDLPNIFNRYFQSNNKDKAIEGGTGIGLALTKELVELMDGKISVQSKLGKGTEFEVKLPISLVTSHQPNVRRFENEQPEISTEKYTILLVEDNPSLQEFIQSVLAPHYNVIVTGNGVEALEQLATRNPQLVLSDVMMPEMDGFTLLEKVKSNDQFCSIPFILLTARADMKDKLHALRIGVDDYMTKPFEVEELLLRTKKLIENSKNREPLPVTSSQLPVDDNAKEQKTENKKQATRNRQSATVKDLTWLKQVEEIAIREIRNRNYKTEDLAQELLISHRQLFRKIKAITGLPPKKYMKTIKLQRAKYILETEEVYTLSEICHAIGMSNTTQFANSYEAEFGKRPHELLKITK
jgi:signal transduction histidine kinase/DNA-binding response OmpR family regulator/ligand-binding sensor domain-containing protein